MSKPRFTPHTLYHVLFESEINKYRPHEFGTPFVCGQPSYSLVSDNEGDPSPFEINHKQVSYFYSSLQKPKIKISPRSSSSPSSMDIEEQHQQQDLSAIDKFIKMNNGLELQYPIIADMDFPSTDALIRCGTQISSRSDGDIYVNALEIDKSQITFLDEESFDYYFESLVTHIAWKMGLHKPNTSHLKYDLEKLFIFRPGDFIPLQKVNMKSNYHIGKVMLQLPTTGFIGGDVIVSYLGETMKERMDYYEETAFFAFKSASEIEIKPIEKGLRMILMFDINLDLEMIVESSLIADNKIQGEEKIDLAEYDDDEFEKTKEKKRSWMYYDDDDDDSLEEEEEESEKDYAFIRKMYGRQSSKNNQTIWASPASFDSINQSTVTKAFKKMVESKSFLYPLQPYHGFMLTNKYDFISKFYYDDDGFPFATEDIKLCNFMKLIAIEAYGGDDKFEMGLFSMKPENSYGIKEATVNFVFESFFHSRSTLGDDIKPFSITSYDWLAQRIYPIQLKLISQNMNSITGYCVLIWPATVGVWTRRGYILPLDPTKDEMKQFAYDASLIFLSSEAKKDRDLSGDLRKAITKVIKDNENHTIKDTVEEFAVVIIYAASQSMIFRDIDGILDFLEEKGIAKKADVLQRIMDINPAIWADIMYSITMRMDLTPKDEIYYKNIVAEIRMFFSDRVIGKRVGKESNEIMNLMLKSIADRLNQLNPGYHGSISEEEEKRSLPKEYRLQIFKITAQFFIERTFFAKYSSTEMNLERLYLKIKISNRGNIYSDQFKIKRQVRINGRLTDPLQWSQRQLEHYLEEACDQINLDYEVAYAWMKIFNYYIGIFPDEHVTQLVMPFTRQFKHFTNKKTKEKEDMIRMWAIGERDD